MTKRALAAPLIEKDEAHEIFKALSAGRTYENPEVEYWRDSEFPERLLDTDLEDLAEELDSAIAPLKRKYEKLSRSSGAELDTVVAPIIRSHLDQLVDPKGMHRLGFWRWLSNAAVGGYFWRLIDFRFSGEAKRAEINWAITDKFSDRFETYLFRIYCKAGFFRTLDPARSVEFSARGGSEEWRSNIFRLEIGKSPTFVHAWLAFAEEQQLNSSRIRSSLVPSLRAWLSSGAFAHLSFEESKELIKNIYEQGI